MTAATRSPGRRTPAKPSAIEDAAPPPDPAVGFGHNRDNPSTAEMAEMLREVQDTLAALDGRLAGLEGESSLVTRRLASNVADMGQALAGRLKSLETGRPAPEAATPAAAPTEAGAPEAAPFAPAARPRPARAPRGKGTGPLALAVIILIALVLIGLWVIGRGHSGAQPPVKPPIPGAGPARGVLPS